MRITLDATPLLLKSAGVKAYFYYWYRTLAAAATLRGDAISIYPPGLAISGGIDAGIGALSRATAFFHLQVVGFSNIRCNPLLDFLLSGSDLCHCSQHMARLPKRGKTTATIFDFSCWRHPETHTDRNISATKRYAEKILKRCDALIAISEHARCDALEILGIPQERIRVIYPGVAEAFFNVRDTHVDAIRSRYALPPSYLLFVGCIEPRKNVRGLIRAYEQMPEAIRRDVPLVIAGPFGWETSGIRPLFNRNHVRYLGYVPEVDLPALFRGASVFVYPSYYEGFGLPVAQAMAAGIPVVTSNCSCLPEVVGDGGLTVDPNSAADLADALYRLLTSPDLALELARRGRIRAQSYHWPAAATASLDFFDEIGNSG
jgi:glycosyltransferase involved in cell wall biosynthesis